MSFSEERAHQLSGGVFMIGLAMLFLTGYWFPGILFVLAATSFVEGMAQGRRWYTMQGAMWLAGIGLVFQIGFSLPLLFLLIGASTIMGAIFKPPFLEDDEDDEVIMPRKRKNEELWIEDDDDGNEYDDMDDSYSDTKRKRQ